jgi:hypothetical protein
MPGLSNDTKVLRELGKKYMEAAMEMKNEEARRLWRKLNGLKPERPMVTIHQLPWNELNVDNELTPRCSDLYLRKVETGLRRDLFSWKHFPVDMTLDPFIQCQLCIDGITFGIYVNENVAVTDATSDVRGHGYINQIRDEEDLEKIRMPDPVLNAAETERRYHLLQEVFTGVVPVEKVGYQGNLAVWDRIVEFISPEGVLFDLIDRPEFSHKMTELFFRWHRILFEKMEARGLLAAGVKLIHCTGAFSDELPTPGFIPEKPKMKDRWIHGAAQIFSTVSPQMHDEFEISYTKPLFEKFGLGYYGCCEPLDRKVGIISKIKNVRKVSMSPWADKDRGAEALGTSFVFSSKPNPTFLAPADFHIEQTIADIKETMDICKRYSTPVEFILKDVSTVNYKPARLTEWADAVMKTIVG